MKLNEYLRQGRELIESGEYQSDGCSLVGWLVHRVWPEAINACWSHDLARTTISSLHRTGYVIDVKDQSENDNLFKDALKYYGVPRPVRFLMYTFTKTQGFMKDSVNMELPAFLGFLLFLCLVAISFYFGVVKY